MPVATELFCLTNIPSELELVLFSFSNTYIVALTSVVLPSVPPSPQYIRSEVICAGFLIQPVDSSSCTVCLMKCLCLNSFSMNFPQISYSSQFYNLCPL